MTSILDKIFDVRRSRVEAAKRTTSIEELRDEAAQVRGAATPYRFFSSLLVDGINIIAEFKKASPSKGILNASADPATIGAMYQNAGAAAISVLTEEDHFLGSLDDLRAIREAVQIPILRKDFVFDEFQVYESAAAGADAILLIGSYLDIDRLRELRSLAEDELGLDALVEVHTADELENVVRTGAKLVGVNNRNLRTFDVSLDVSRELAAVAPSNVTLVAESGLRTREDLIELRSLGYSAFLIGETLMKSGDAGCEIRELARVHSE
ncbi:MAG TPA: indole-3-glycerol phosphate synthase TrpC [Pyrinomonadaceae bacterium]|nr:indole-3-glycerol phosphate synthase TrpC [Pyrinomonadaceae bacterium]